MNAEQLQNKMLREYYRTPEKCIEHIEAVEWLLKIVQRNSDETIADLLATLRTLKTLKEKCSA